MTTYIGNSGHDDLHTYSVHEDRIGNSSHEDLHTYSGRKDIHR